MTKLDPGVREIILEFAAVNDAMHPTYGSTSTCHGGVGGQMITQHCVHTCYNEQAHEKVLLRYYNAYKSIRMLLDGATPEQIALEVQHD